MQPRYAPLRIPQKVAGIDLTDKKFWENSMLSYRHNVDEFERLSKKLNK